MKLTIGGRKRKILMWKTIHRERGRETVNMWERRSDREKREIEKKWFNMKERLRDIKQQRKREGKRGRRMERNEEFYWPD